MAFTQGARRLALESKRVLVHAALAASVLGTATTVDAQTTLYWDGPNNTPGNVATFTNASPALSASYTLVDNTTVGNSALVLLKEVRNLTTGGTWGTSNQAKSGQLLEYRVTYTNTTKSPMTKVSIADTVPAYTTFQSATVGAVPNDLGTCTMNTPANPAPATAVACTTLQSTGGTGSLRWMFDGKLDPAATGDVSFKVKVD